jgi:hypothetical protein
MLVTHPIDQTLASMFEIGSWIFVNEALLAAMIVCLLCVVQFQSGSNTWTSTLSM